jgi:hypothetical protein
LDHTGVLSLRVLSTAGKGHKGIRVAFVSEATLANSASVLAVEESALEGNIVVARVEHQRIGLSCNKRLALVRGDNNTLVDRGDVVRAIMERSQDVGTVGNLGVALLSQSRGFDVLLGCDLH